MAVDTEKLAPVRMAGSGFDSQSGGFTHIFMGDRSYTKAEVVAALRRVAEPVGLAELTLHCITSADPGAQSEQTLAHDMAMMARQAVERLNEGRAEPVGEDRVERVARALFAHDEDGNSPVKMRCSYEQLLTHQRRAYEARARAAIAGDDRVARLTEALGRIFDTLKYSPNPYAMDAVRIARAALEDTRDGN